MKIKYWLVLSNNTGVFINIRERKAHGQRRNASTVLRKWRKTIIFSQKQGTWR